MLFCWKNNDAVFLDEYKDFAVQTSDFKHSADVPMRQDTKWFQNRKIRSVTISVPTFKDFTLQQGSRHHKMKLCRSTHTSMFLIVSFPEKLLLC